MISILISRIIRTLAIPFITAATILNAQVEDTLDARAEDEKTIKVGYYYSEHFQEGMDSNSVKNGYAYEYLQAVANYTGWKYEYVYGDWATLINSLSDGEIDVMAGLSKTYERERVISYPIERMGSNSYYLYKTQNEQDVTAYDLSGLEGKTVGLVSGDLMNERFSEWLNDAGYSCNQVLYSTFAALIAAAESGEISLFVAKDNDVRTSSGYSPLSKIAATDYYLAVAKERDDLLEELNAALIKISQSNPYLLQELQIKYFQNTSVNSALSQDELKWVNENDHLTIGYIKSYLPFCGSSGSGVTGVLTDIVQEWKENFSSDKSIEIKCSAYNNYSEIVDAVSKGEIDACFPVMNNYWSLEQEGIISTRSLINSTVSIIYKGEYNDTTTDSIAVSAHSAFQKNYANVFYPNSTIVERSSPEECLKAVNEGSAKCTFYNATRAQLFLEGREYASLRIMPSDYTLEYGVGVKRGNTVVYSILQHGFASHDVAEATSKLFNYMETSKTFSKVLYENIGWITMVLLAVLVLITAGLWISVVNNSKRKAAMAELQSTQNQLKMAAKEAEDASNAKTAFLFNMSHDIRTPMNAILGFTDLLKRHGDDEAKRVEYIEKINSSGNTLLSILNNILEMSRIEKGTVVVERVGWSFEQFSDTLYSVFKTTMEQKGIEFINEVNVQHNYVFCDPAKIREIFLNILSNAQKYTNKGGKVVLKIDELPSEKEGYAVFQTTISDTGIGMDKSFIPTIFEEFSRERNNEGNRIEGTGLGMAIVKRLVDMIGGTIAVESEKGVGTTFTVITSHEIAKREDCEVHISHKENNPAFIGKRILLAEDNDLNAEIAIEILQEYGFSVERAPDGAMAIDMLSSHEGGYYEVILMDVQMPNINGYEATRLIRGLKDGTKAKIPIVAMTANAFEEDKRQAIESGMDGHLGKPIIVRDLLDVLSRYFSGGTIK